MAPEGWCSPRSQVLGALLDDLAAGKSVEAVRKAHDAKVNPLAYQRPVAPPKAGTIDQAEALFEKLNLGRSLERRLARASEIRCFWLPATPAKRADGLFADLRVKAPSSGGARNVQRPDMSWRTFCEEFLDRGDVREIFVQVPASTSSFVQYTAAVHDDAEPILKWDLPGARNHWSWYFYAASMSASRFNLEASAWAKCLGVAISPAWVGNTHGHGLPSTPVLLLEGAYDTQARHLGLFPECLRSELHGVRSVIEEHCKWRGLVGEGIGCVPAVPLACGLQLPAESRREGRVRIRAVLRNGMSIETIIDRVR